MSEDIEAVKVNADAEVKVAELKVKVAELITKGAVTVSGIAALGFGVFGITKCSSEESKRAAAEAESKSETDQVALENGYEQVRAGLFFPEVIWKKTDGTTFTGDLDAERAAGSEAKTR